MGIQYVVKFGSTQGLRPVGWGEVFYETGSSIDTGVLSTFLRPDSWGYKRLMCLGAGALATYARVSIVGDGIAPAGPSSRNSRPLTLPIPTPAKLEGLPSYNPLLSELPADFSQSVYMMRAIGVTLTQRFIRSFWIAGMPDLAQAINIPNLLGGAWRTALNEFKAASLNKLCVRGVTRGDATTFKLCTAYNNGTLTYTVPNHGFTSGQRCTAVGFRVDPGDSAPRGVYRVNVVDANNIVLQGANLAGPFKALGGFRTNSIVYAPITEIIERSYSNKKKGRPFGLLVGRQQKPLRPRA